MLSETDVKPRSYTGNLILPLIVLVVTLIFYYLTFSFPDQEEVGPAAVPHLWMFFISVFCVILIIRAFRRTGKPDPVAGQVFYVLLFAGWMMLYVMAIQTAGYYLSSFVFLCSSIYLMGYRKVSVIVTVVLLWLIFCYFIFVKLLYIPLPTGPLLSTLIT